MLLYFYIICYLWYIFNECPLRAIEEYLTGNKSKGFDEKKYKVIYILGKRHVIFDSVIDIYSIVFPILFILFFIKILYLMKSKKYIIKV